MIKLVELKLIIINGMSFDVVLICANGSSFIRGRFTMFAALSITTRLIWGNEHSCKKELRFINSKLAKLKRNFQEGIEEIEETIKLKAYQVEGKSSRDGEKINTNITALGIAMIKAQTGDKDSTKTFLK